MNIQFSIRLFYLLVFLTCAGLLGFGLFLEHFKNLEPCPLCIFQRIAFIAIALTALMATIHGPGYLGGVIYSSLILLGSLTGAAIAVRQVWLQHLPPDQVPECGPGLEYLLDAFPLTEALKMVLSGSGECAEVQWRFLGLSIPEWSLGWFIILGLAGLISVFFLKKS